MLLFKIPILTFSGLGVFAKEFIPRGVKVGPYEGTTVLKEDMYDIEDTSYMWEVHILHVLANVPTNKINYVQALCMLYAHPIPSFLIS